MLISWADGVEKTPAGVAREIVQPNMWSSSVFVTPSGSCYRRYWNAVSNKWSAWDTLEPILDHETQSKLGYTLATCWTSVETCIATAWLHRRPESRAKLRILDPSEPNAKHLQWGEPEDYPEAGDLTGETWMPLRWYCGHVRCDPRYSISSHGRLKSPFTGKVTRGFAARGTRWAAVKGAGLVDLLQASGLTKAEKTIPERLFMAYCSISSGIPVKEHAQRNNLTVNTAWAYYNQAIPLVENRKLYGKQHVNPDVWLCLELMHGKPLLGGKLSELQLHVSKMLKRDDVPFEEVRFARTCLT